MNSICVCSIPSSATLLCPKALPASTWLGKADQADSRIDGTVHADGAAYVDPGVKARGVDLDARVHADPERLSITSVVARLRQGGQLEGEVLLDHWIPPIPGAHEFEAVEPSGKHATDARSQVRSKAPSPHGPATSTDLYTNGKVTAQFKNVSLDTVLDIVSLPPFQRLGLDARLNGPSTATWTHGDIQTLSIAASLGIESVRKRNPG